ncbi:MAG: hypothetical protein ACYDAQ_10145, partial [Mycobacteriales bacterium]
VLIASVIVAAHSGGFNNLTTLQKSVTQQLDANLQNASSGAYAPGTTVTSTLCVHQSGTQYVCLVQFSNGSKISLPVTVSADGSRWVSNA